MSAYQFSPNLGSGLAQPGGGLLVPVDLEAIAIEGAADYLNGEALKAPSNWKDPVKIAAYIAEAETTRLHKLALDPDLCRIVALGWRSPIRWDAVTRVAMSEAQEAEILTEFWTDLSTFSTVTFRGFSYDLPVLMRRSMYLNLPAWRRLNLDKYRSSHVDLQVQLSYHGALPVHSLRFYCRRLGLESARADVTGAMVAHLAANGQYREIAEHCADDVWLTAALAARLGYAVVPLKADTSDLPDAIF